MQLVECDEVDHACRADRAEEKGVGRQSGKTSKDLIWHLFNRPILTSGINMDDPTEFAGRFHRLILRRLSFQDDK